MRYNDELNWRSRFGMEKKKNRLKRNLREKNCQRLAMDWKWRNKIRKLDELKNGGIINGQ